MCSICNGHPDCPCCHPVINCERCEGEGTIYFIDNKEVTKAHYLEMQEINDELNFDETKCPVCGGAGAIKL